MNRTIDTTSTQQTGIGGVNDGLHFKLGNVLLNYLNHVLWPSIGINHAGIVIDPLMISIAQRRSKELQQ
jgi:hypothetical protein